MKHHDLFGNIVISAIFAIILIAILAIAVGVTPLVESTNPAPCLYGQVIDVDGLTVTIRLDTYPTGVFDGKYVNVCR